MNQNFWDHLLNAAGHLLDASKQSAEEVEMERAERKAKRASAGKRTGPLPVVKPRGASFAEPCCTTERVSGPAKSGQR